MKIVFYRRFLNTRVLLRERRPVLATWMNFLFNWPQPVFYPDAPHVTSLSYFPNTFSMEVFLEQFPFTLNIQGKYNAIFNIAERPDESPD